MATTRVHGSEPEHCRGVCGRSESVLRLVMPAGGAAAAADDLEKLATATTLTGPSAEAEALWERADREAADDGNVSRAVRCGFWLSFLLLNRGEVPRGSGWVDRSQRMLDESRLDCVERGYIRYAAALRARVERRPRVGTHGLPRCGCRRHGVPLDRADDPRESASGGVRSTRVTSPAASLSSTRRWCRSSRGRLPDRGG